VADAGPPVVCGTDSIRVRVACGADADALLPLIQAHADYEKGEASTTGADLRAALDGPRRRLWAWIAEQAGRPIGYATATQDFATWTGLPFLHLDCLFVQDDQRGNGAGARLLDAVRDHAMVIGVTELQWQTPAWNERAQRFYIRAGATGSQKMRFTLKFND
jgi:GNAT superfamily N-acetyltransferase